MSKKRKRPKPHAPQARRRDDAAPSPIEALRAAAPTSPSQSPAAVTCQLELTHFSCDALDDAEPRALGITYWFDPPAEGPVSPVAVEFVGRRTDVAGHLGPDDTFSVRASIDADAALSGRTALTTRVVGVPAGTWQVTATPVARNGHRARPPDRLAAQGSTVFAPIAKVRAPGARLGVWPALVALGTVLAIAVEAILAARSGLPVLRVLAVTLLACPVGLVGAKAYYLATHRGHVTSLVTVGLSLQGFVLAAVAVLVAGAATTGLPVVAVLDVISPGLLYGMAVGRLGCFWGGCCAGRPTRSRWGLWSSDRHVGTRRIPVQLIESAVAASLGSATLLLVVTAAAPRGTAFVVAVASYTLARQLLFPLRAIPRSTAYGRPAMITLSVTTLLVALWVAVAA